MHFGKNIKKIRSIKKLSQAAFADIFDIKRSSVGAYEEQRAEPKLELVSRIAKHFSISVDALINREITVNELSNFHLYENIGSETTQVQIPALNIYSVPLVGINEITNLGIVKAANESEHKITLPDLNKNDIAIYLDAISSKLISEKFMANDIIIIKNEKVDFENCIGKICLVKSKGDLLIGEFIMAGKNEFHIVSTNINPYTMLKSEIEFVSPITCHISRNVVVQDTASEKIKKLEFMVNHLYNRLE